MWRDKSAKKGRFNEENCWEDSWQKCYTDGQINGMTRNIRVSWREIGENGRARDP